MTFMRKINRGFIVFIALILIVIGYLLVLRFLRLDDQQKLQNSVSEYLSVYQKDIILGDQTPENALEKIKNNEISYFVSNDHFASMQSVAQNMLHAQSKFGTIQNYEVHIHNFEPIEFNGKTAKVIVNTIVSYQGPDQIIPSLSSNDSQSQATAQFVFEKIDNEWKIFYFSGYIAGTNNESAMLTNQVNIE
ncbi:MAG: hypothetical protein HFE77_02865 [Clostridiales bacterium]|nr:hypothetical protein [Clostridiales bacterium]